MIVMRAYKKWKKRKEAKRLEEETLLLKGTIDMNVVNQKIQNLNDFTLNFVLNHVYRPQEAKIIFIQKYWRN